MCNIANGAGLKGSRPTITTAKTRPTWLRKKTMHTVIILTNNCAEKNNI